MFMAISPSILVFFFSLLLGFCYLIVWVLFKSLSYCFYSNKKIQFFYDFIFCLIIAFSSILFFYKFTDGHFRFFIILGFILGFILLYFSSYTFIFRFFNLIFTIIKKLLHFIFFPFIFIFRKFKGKLLYFYEQIVNKFKTLLKKPLKVLIFPFKKLYNNLLGSQKKL